MVDELMAGPCLALEVCGQEGSSIVQQFRDFCGPYDPEVARHIKPDSLRGRFGVDKVRNAVHCTDLPEDGPLEVRLLRLGMLTVQVQYFFQILKM